jgi:hypothetical protein
LIKRGILSSISHKITGVALCEKYSIEMTDVVGRIEAFLINNTLEILAIESFGKFEQEIHRESTKVQFISLF